MVYACHCGCPARSIVRRQNCQSRVTCLLEYYASEVWAMERASYTVTLAAALAATPVNANAQDIAAGHAFAREACYACHVIEPEERPRRLLIGPAFRDVANTSGMTAAALQVF